MFDGAKLQHLIEFAKLYCKNIDRKCKYNDLLLFYE